MTEEKLYLNSYFAMPDKKMKGQNAIMDSVQNKEGWSEIINKELE